MPSQTWIVASELTCEVPPTPLVRAQLVGGSVTVTHRAEPGLSLSVSGVVGDPIEVVATSTEVTIGYATIGWEGWLKRLGSYRSSARAELVVAVGPETDLRLATVGAAVSVAGVDGSTTVATASGAVHVSDVRGPLTARTVSGPVTVLRHAGTVRAQTVSGPVDIAGDLPRVDVATVSGAVAVATTRGTSVVRAQTVSAPVAVVIPAGVGVAVTARSAVGGLTLDGEPRRSTGVPGTVHVEERGDGEAAFVDIVTVTGPASVTHAEQPPD